MNTSLIDFDAIERILLKAPVDWRVKEIQALAFLFIELRGVIANNSHLAKFVRSRLGSLKRRGQPRKDGSRAAAPETHFVPFGQPMRKDQAIELHRRAVDNRLGLIGTRVWHHSLQSDLAPGIRIP